MASAKEKLWKAAYYQCWNATEAARRAGYQWPNKKGPLIKAKFADEIKAHIDELIMSADEALVLLSDQARGSLGDFADVQVLADLKDHPKARLVKSLVSDVYQDKGGQIHYKARIELHDQQRAIEDILKIHGKFTEKVEHSGDVGLKIEYVNNWRQPSQDET